MRKGTQVVLAVLLSLAVDTSLLVSTAQADAVQISDSFRRVSKAVARDLVKGQLEKVCKDATEHNEICKALASDLADLAADAASGSSNAPAVVTRFRRTLQQALASVALAEVRVWSSKYLEPAFGKGTSELATQAVECVAEWTMAGNKATCTALVKSVSSFGRCAAQTAPVERTKCVTAAVKDLIGDDAQVSGTVAQFERGVNALAQCVPLPDRAEQAVCVADSVAEMVGTDGALADASLQLKIIARVLRDVRKGLVTRANLADVVRAIVDQMQAYDEHLISSPSSHLVFDSTSIQKASRACPAQATALEAFETNRLAAYDAYSSAIVSGEPLSSVGTDKRSPVQASPACTDPAYTVWHDSARGFIAHAELSAALHKVEVPALVVAALIDAVQGDDSKARDSAISIAVHVLSRQVGRSSAVNACGPTTGGFLCARVDGRTFKVATTASDHVVDQLFDRRRGVGAASLNCLVQLTTAALSPANLTRSVDGGTKCWLDTKAADVVAISKLLGVGLAPATGFTVTAVTGTIGDLPGVYEWPAAAVVSIAPDTYRVTVDYKEAPKRLLELAAESLRGRFGLPNPDVDVAGELERILRNANDPNKVLVAGLAVAAGLTLKAPLEKFINKMFPSCKDGDASTRCAVRALAIIMYESAVVTTFSSDSDQRLIDELVRRTDAIKEDILDKSPLLFEVGLGYNSVGVFTGVDGDEEYTQHFTVVDKWGVVYRGGGWYVGGFVGGFVDAIVRDENPRWLAGATLGVPRLSEHFPFGFSVHGAWAPPVDLDESAKAFAVGASLTIPTSYLLED
jgi:hypothetical protein